jgi:methylated-DNA-[protein]-cysteine S-methyltransferase
MNHSDPRPAAIATSAGVFRATFGPRGLRSLEFPDGRIEEAAADERARELADQLDGYLRGELTEFSIPLDPAGTAFQLRVWEELRRIPYGQTRSYLEVATAIGRPERARAVGAANGANPIPILIPCHRVIGSDGSLVGFGAGLGWKRRLLELERPQLRLALA